MPMSIIRNSRGTGKTTSKAPSDRFTGDVWVDSAFSDGKLTMANVTFTPCARTNWHTHEHGQFLQIIAGSGWICDKGEEPQLVKVGDLIWCPPGTTHWHGASAGSYMTHLAIGFGNAEWHEAVPDEDYSKAE